MKEKYSIVIPFHSNHLLLTNCILSLIKTVPSETEIIIIANNSNPKEIDISYPYSNIRIYKYEQDLMYPKAVNLGISLAGSDNIILSDADTYYTKDWFNQITFCYRETEAAIVGAKLLFTDNNRVRDFGMGFNGYNWPHPFKNRLNNHPLVIENRPFQSVCTASCLINREKCEKIGGFSEELGFSYSDMDLCLRFLEKGYSVWGCGKAEVYHKGSSTKRDFSHYRKDIRGKFFERNSLRFKIDMQIYYEQSSIYFKGKSLLKKEYVLIDLSSVYNKEWHYDLIRELLEISILDYYSFEQTSRDLRNLELYENIPSYIFHLKAPLIYFVDNYTSLQNNSLWRLLRDEPNDLVIDRHGNIELFVNLSNG